MYSEDIKNEVILYFKQIKDLSDLMIEADNISSTNLMTISNLAQIGSEMAEKLDKIIN